MGPGGLDWSGALTTLPDGTLGQVCRCEAENPRSALRVPPPSISAAAGVVGAGSVRPYWAASARAPALTNGVWGAGASPRTTAAAAGAARTPESCTDGEDSWWFSVAGTVFDYAIACPFTAPTDAESRAETLRFVWKGYLEAREKKARRSLEDWRALVKVYDGTREPGLFWPEDHAGFDEFAFLRALDLLDTFRDLIPNDDEKCPNARTLIGNALDPAVDFPFGLHVDNRELIDGTRVCEGQGTIIRDQTNDDSLPKQIALPDLANMKNASTTPVLNDIFVCDQYVQNWASIADEFLFHSNTIYWAYVEGQLVHGGARHGFDRGDPLYFTDAVELNRVLQLAQQSGSLALSAVSQIAAILLHEMLHCYYFLGSHCDYGFCFQSIALRWRAAVHAKLGLFPVDETNLNTSLTNAVLFERSSDKVLSENYSGDATLERPGRPSGPHAFTLAETRPPCAA